MIKDWRRLAKTILVSYRISFEVKIMLSASFGILQNILFPRKILKQTFESSHAARTGYLFNIPKVTCSLQVSKGFLTRVEGDTPGLYKC